MNPHVVEALKAEMQETSKPNGLTVIGAIAAVVIALVLWSGLVMLTWNTAFPGHQVDLFHAASIQVLVLLLGSPLLLTGSRR